ncbi:hypothetical protein AVEN_160270-1 [Araneus ventricosus]|uniref:Uncharacterized protein n=1 Tax=Araneus ventricosus TaxID=182803 RepID=A0A4Y2P1E0_ARAVE|nr:hypothetical protein AVEN_160270-1 [Araneus ventricosus]
MAIISSADKCSVFQAAGSSAPTPPDPLLSEVSRNSRSSTQCLQLPILPQTGEGPGLVAKLQLQGKWVVLSSLDSFKDPHYGGMHVRA